MKRMILLLTVVFTLATVMPCMALADTGSRPDIYELFVLETPEYIDTQTGLITSDDTVFVFLEGVCLVNQEPCVKLLERRYMRGEYVESIVVYRSVYGDYVYSSVVKDNLK